MRPVKRVIVLVAGHASYGREVARGIYDYCLDHPLWQVFYEGSFHSMVCANIGAAIRKWHADGFIGQMLSGRVANMVCDAGIPAVDVSHTNVDPHLTVNTSASGIATLSAKYFLEKGFKSFAYCCSGSPYSQRLYSLFRDELGKAGLPCEILTIGHYQKSWIQEHDKIGRWLGGLKKPAGLFTIFDFFGRNLAGICRDFGIHVPDAVAIMGMGNDESECVFSTPPLSSVMLPGRQTGYEALALLDRVISRRGRGGPTSVVLQPAGIAERQSTNTMAVKDPEVAAALRFMRDHAGEPITVHDVCGELAVSKRSLELHFSKILGRSPHEEILKARAESVKALLRDTDQKVQTLAKIAGFNSYAGFARFFRKLTGMTPTDYRAKARPG